MEARRWGSRSFSPKKLGFRMTTFAVRRNTVVSGVDSFQLLMDVPSSQECHKRHNQGDDSSGAGIRVSATGKHEERNGAGMSAVKPPLETNPRESTGLKTGHYTSGSVEGAVEEGGQLVDFVG